MRYCSLASHNAQHVQRTAAHPLAPAPSDSIRVGRRWFLQTGMAGIAGVSLADTLRLSAAAATNGRAADKRAVIVFWLSGGPSHIDMWDPKSDAPIEIRGPYQTIG